MRDLETASDGRSGTHLRMAARAFRRSHGPLHRLRGRRGGHTHAYCELRAVRTAPPSTSRASPWQLARRSIAAIGGRSTAWCQARPTPAGAGSLRALRRRQRKLQVHLAPRWHAALLPGARTGERWARPETDPGPPRGFGHCCHLPVRAQRTPAGGEAHADRTDPPGPHGASPRVGG